MAMNVKAKEVIAHLLMAFVLVSIGFALGKEVTLRRISRPQADLGPSTVPAAGPEVMVYYMYPTIRCITCNQIEAAAYKVVHEDFAKALGDGRLGWRVVNIHENDELAKRFDVAASTVVVARRRGGKEEGYDRLDKVWPLAGKPEELSAYIRTAVAAALRKGEAK